MPLISANGRQLFFEDYGEGTPVVFLSGLGGDHRAFAVPQRWFAKDRRALALDNRDVGQSDRAAMEYSTCEMADDVAAWLKAVGAFPADIVGHSLGGLIAQQLVLRHPGMVRGLVFASTHAGSDPWRKAVLESWVITRHRTEAAEFSKASLPWLVAPSFYKNATQVEGLVRFAERNSWPQDAFAFERQAKAAMGHDTRSQLGEVNAPTLVLAGELDIVNPPRVAKEVAELIVGARFIEMPGVGHLPHVENVGEFRQIIAEFFNELD